MKTLLTTLLFQAGWFACVLGAAYDMEWIGPAVVIAVVITHLVLAGKVRERIIIIGLCAAVGVIVESVFYHLGFIVYEGAPLIPGLCPLWMVLLWANMAIALDVLGPLLAGRPKSVAILGGVSGPLAYWGGERLGALMISATGFAVLAGVWAVALPMLVFIFNRLNEQQSKRAPGERSNEVASGRDSTRRASC